MTIAYLIDPSSGEVKAVARSGHSFGLAASMPNYARRPCVLVAVARRAFAAPAHYFVDDVTAVDLECALGQPAFTVADADAPPLKSFPFSAQGSVRHLAMILRVNLPLAKSTLPSEVSDNCGVTTDCSSLARTGTVRLRVKQSTRVKIVDRASEALTLRRITPIQAGSLAAKFRWGFLLSRVGSAATQPLLQRQHQASDSSRMTSPIAAALHFLVDTLSSDVSDVVIRARADPDEHVLALSDASFVPPIPPVRFGRGMIAFIVFFPASVEFGPAVTFVASTDVSEEVFAELYSLRVQSTFIHGLEAIGQAAPYSAPELQARLRGRSILHCADNQSANQAFTRGYSSSPDIAHIISGAHSSIVKLGARFWLLYTQSGPNLADMPTRGGCSFVELHTGARRIPFTMSSFSSRP